MSALTIATLNVEHQRVAGIAFFALFAGFGLYVLLGQRREAIRRARGYDVRPGDPHCDPHYDPHACSPVPHEDDPPTCASCRVALPDGARFCPACGAGAAAGQGGGPRMPPPPSPAAPARAAWRAFMPYAPLAVAGINPLWAALVAMAHVGGQGPSRGNPDWRTTLLAEMIAPSVLGLFVAPLVPALARPTRPSGWVALLVGAAACGAMVAGICAVA